MGQIDNLNDPMAEIRDLMRRVRQLERATPLNNASIGRNGLRVYGGGSITIENNGGITITGPDGQLIGSGTIEWTGTMTNTGPVNLDGDTTIGGTLHVNGATDINETLAVKGATTLSNSLNVASGGGITIDSTNPLMLSPAGNHAIEWGSGAYLASNDAGVGIGAGGHNAAIQAAADGTAELFYPSGQVAVWTSAVNGLSFYSPDGSKVMRLTNTGLVGP